MEGRGHGLHVRQGGVGLRRAPQLELPRLLAQGATEAAKVRAAVAAGLVLEVVRPPYARPRLVGQARDEALATVRVRDGTIAQQDRDQEEMIAELKKDAADNDRRLKEAKELADAKDKELVKMKLIIRNQDELVTAKEAELVAAKAELRSQGP